VRELQKKALERAGLKAEDIDHVICSTLGGDFLTPSLACALSQRLNLSCPAFDINAACSGFIYALDLAQSYLLSNKAEKILIVCAEMMSKHTDWQDRSSCVLFGDGAGACIVTKGNAVNYTKLYTKGDTKLLYLEDGNGNNPFRKDKKERGFLQMQGQEVFKFAVSIFESLTKEALDSLSLSPEEIDLFILHQANKRIIDSARTKLKLPEEKFPINIDKYGNISSASILILLDELLCEGRIKKGDKLLFSAFGAGLTAGICVMTWE
jgi:3-oxoacyl-[acyl-carrier-protein] synthase-3